MTRPYPEQLSQWINGQKASKQAKNLSAFLAVKKDISDALEAGFAAKTIWAHLKASQKIAFSYDTFLNLIKRHVSLSLNKEEETPRAEAPLEATTPCPSTEVANDENKQATPVQEGPTGFLYNPTPNLKELV